MLEQYSKNEVCHLLMELIKDLIEKNPENFVGVTIPMENPRVERLGSQRLLIRWGEVVEKPRLICSFEASHHSGEFLEINFVRDCSNHLCEVEFFFPFDGLLELTNFKNLNLARVKQL